MNETGSWRKIAKPGKTCATNPDYMRAAQKLDFLVTPLTLYANTMK